MSATIKIPEAVKSRRALKDLPPVPFDWREKPPTTAVCNPNDLVPLARSEEREKLAILAVCVVQKPADITWIKVQKFLTMAATAWGQVKLFGSLEQSPFELLSWLKNQGKLRAAIEAARFGQYQRTHAALARLADLSRTPWTWTDLLKCPGISLKTAKLVELYRWPGQRVACLDRHVLRAMGGWRLTQTLGIKVPEVSPQNYHQYAVLEEVFCQEADRLGVPCWLLDRWCWQQLQRQTRHIQSAG